MLVGPRTYIKLRAKLPMAAKWRPEPMARMAARRPDFRGILRHSARDDLTSQEPSDGAGACRASAHPCVRAALRIRPRMHAPGMRRVSGMRHLLTPLG